MGPRPPRGAPPQCRSGRVAGILTTLAAVGPPQLAVEAALSGCYGNRSITLGGASWGAGRGRACGQKV